MESISALSGIHGGTPGFILGNGKSRLFYNIPLLKDHGIMLGCNLAFKEYPMLDYLGFRDDPAIEECLTWPGTKLTAERHLHDIPKIAKRLGGMKGKLYSWIYAKENTKKLGKGEVIKGSTGVILAQVAVHLGCDPIVLVGCDCCKMDGFSSSNACYDDAHIKQRQATLNKFKTQFHKFRDRFKSKRIYKLGNHGELELPIVTMREIMQEAYP